MALRYSIFSAPIVTQNHDLIKGSRNNRFVMCCNNHISVNLQIRSFDIKNKVFEDRSTGIVCYKDENGEITCEGYDEGPRFHHQLPRFNCNSRDVEILDLLQRCWLNVGDDGEFSINGEKGIAAGPSTDYNCNGFNKLY